MTRWIYLFLASITPFIAYSQQYTQNQPLYHANGIFASSGISEHTFFHENGSVAWYGVNNVDPRIFHSNGAIAWQGYFSGECIFSYSSCSIYHNNGSRAWKGCTYHEATFSNDSSFVFHDNGTVAWKGALFKDCLAPYSDCSVFHRNGQLAWKGMTPKQCHYAYETCKIVHSNGKTAWRGSFASEASSVLACGVFHDNGELAWSGRQGEPIYDRYGRTTAANATEITMPLGENSFLYLNCEGMRILNISVGEESFIIFSNQEEENPTLRIHLGTGYELDCFPYTGDMPQMNVYGTPIPVREQ